MQQHGSKYFACSPPLPSEGQNSTFSEHGHAAHQRNRECSNMVATVDRGTINMKHIKRDFGSKTCARPPWVDLGDGIKMSNFNFFRTWSCCISN